MYQSVVTVLVMVKKIVIHVQRTVGFAVSVQRVKYLTV